MSTLIPGEYQDAGPDHPSHGAEFTKNLGELGGRLWILETRMKTMQRSAALPLFCFLAMAATVHGQLGKVAVEQTIDLMELFQLSSRHGSDNGLLIFLQTRLRLFLF